GAVTRRFFAAANAVGGEMMGDRGRVERLHAQAKMIEIGAARARRARRRSRRVGRNDVDQRVPGAQLRQRALAFFERAAQYIHVEALERGRIGGAQHHVVAAENGTGRSHASVLSGGKLRPSCALERHRAAAWIRAYYTLPTLLQLLSLTGVYACLRRLWPTACGPDENDRPARMRRARGCDRGRRPSTGIRIFPARGATPGCSPARRPPP